MIYLIKTKDRRKGVEKLSRLQKALLKKKPNSQIFSIDSDNFNTEKIKELIYSSGLFENKYIVSLKNIFSDRESCDAILSFVKEIRDSENIFIFLETDLNKVTAKRIEKMAEKTEEIEGEKTIQYEEIKLFSLTDSLGSRNRKKSWVLYRKALLFGKSPEEIHGMLFWQIKNLILAGRAKRADEVSLNPFVFRKAKSYSKNFSEKELKEASFNLVKIYHQARRGIIDLELGIEKFLLEI